MGLLWQVYALFSCGSCSVVIGPVIVVRTYVCNVWSSSLVMYLCACACVWPDDAQFEAASEDQVCGVLRKVALSRSNFKDLKDIVRHRLTTSGRYDCK